ncbi:TPA: hypothetical protein K8T78_002167 [Listeria monocytogenes]|uniref:hypothetical protein n=1 Tax=Listeria monocytogenes TaxID=1639 RepID=UPI00086D22D5|nr:hypothetical protein [Listeria monocytogenes]EIA7757000.1 hypothetical protein [Listeria monocytogenes]OER87018.1 hypothetical protein AJQ30_07155 [Listeria monocytogenes]HBI7403282.1 hypothetical protein [Listeria monocytogenes]
MRLTFDIETVDDALELQKILKVLSTEGELIQFSTEDSKSEIATSKEQEEQEQEEEEQGQEEQEEEEQGQEEQEEEQEEQEEQEQGQEEEEQTLTLADVKRAVSRFEGGTKNVQVKFVMVTAFKVTALNKLKPSDYQDFIEMLDEREKEFGLSQNTDKDASENEDRNKSKQNTSDEEVLTLDALRVMVRPFVQSQNNKAVKKILRGKFGVEAMAELDEEDYPAFVAELEKSKKKLGL